MKTPIEERVVLVNDYDEPLGTAPKLDVHRTGQLHRAVSVFVFDPEGRWLLQRRAPNKYHSGGKWSNACCSHPRPDEFPADAARRRLREEIGLDEDIRPLFRMRYRADVGEGLVEHEFDHVFVAETARQPVPNPAEVADLAWLEEEELTAAMEHDPLAYTEWFRLAFREVASARRADSNGRLQRLRVSPNGSAATFLFSFHPDGKRARAGH